MNTKVKSVGSLNNISAHKDKDKSSVAASNQATSELKGQIGCTSKQTKDEAQAEPQPSNGDIKQHDGKICIFIDGYWIRYYPAPLNTMSEKKALILSLRKRVFHHTEAGINSPGWRTEIARKYYEKETDVSRKRVNAAMLAGSLFNRATDIFTNIVDLEKKGIHVAEDNPLMQQCEACFMEALQLGKEVKHFSGEEGVDELWGEPFKAFSMPPEKFFHSRYIKLSQTFAAIDKIVDKMQAVFGAAAGFAEVLPMLEELRLSARTEAETMRRDEVIFEVWPRYVAAKEAIAAYRPSGEFPDADRIRSWEDGIRLLRKGVNVISYISGVRVPMPLTTQNFIRRCERYEQSGSLDREFSPSI